MKRIKPLFVTLCVVSGVVITAAFLTLVIGLGLFGPDIGTAQKFADKDNYVKVEGTIKEATERDGSYYIRLKVTNGVNVYDSFKLSGENYSIAKRAGADDALKAGNPIAVWIVTDYLGDGWSYPIGSLAYDGKEYLSLDAGSANIAVVQERNGRIGILFAAISGGIIGLGLVLLAVNFIIYFRGAPEQKQAQPAHTI